jgi:hypothetical protein
MRSAPTDAGICGLLQESKDVGKALSRTFDQRRDAIAASDLDLFAVGGTSGAAATVPSTATQKGDFDAAVRALAGTLPGVFVADGPSVRFGPDYTALGQIAHAIPDRRLLQVAGSIVVGGSPMTFEPPAVAKCSDLAATLAAVKAITHVWTAAPLCLQDALAVDLDARIGEIAAARYGGASATFCQSKEDAQVIGGKLADLIAKNKYLGGTDNAEFLRQSLAGADAAYLVTPSAPPPPSTPKP